MALRIVSLLPSATEIICSLGIGDQLVGVTHECDVPEFVRRLPKVTRTLIPVDASSAEIDQLVRERLKDTRALYTLDLPVLRELQPDLIVTQALCDVCAVAEADVSAAVCELPGGATVVNLEPETVWEVLESIRDVGRAAAMEDRADRVVMELTARIDAVRKRSEDQACRPRVVLLEWLDPPFSCGHWSPELVRLAGGVEGLGKEGVRSRTLRWDEVIAWEPEVVCIACCGFTVDRTMQEAAVLSAVPGWRDLPAVRAGRVFVVNGSDYFSRPGPRLVDSLEILAHAIDPTVHPLPRGLPQPTKLSVP